MRPVAQKSVIQINIYTYSHLCKKLLMHQKGENVNDSNTNLKLIIKVIFQLNFQALHDD